MEVAMMKALGSDQFEALLRHLGPDRETAGRQYEQLRVRLLAVFTYRRCPHPEDLADETMDRVARKLLEIGDRFEGADASRFVFGVAWNIAKESFHRRREVALPDTWDVEDPVKFDPEKEAGDRSEVCLERCLRSLPESDRDLVLRYFQHEKRAKIDQRSSLARELQISPNALRLRIHRTTGQLRSCVRDCLESSNPRPGGDR
jgi:DNA-directed RNA polymerase specialized sigma24 family protein